MKQVLLVLPLIAVLTLFGGGACASPRPAEIVVIGNSLALIQDWRGGSGLAASEPAKDYAHLIGAARVFNLATLERGQPYTAPSGPIDTLVLQLGDNVAPLDLPGFAARYAELLRKLKPKRLVCVSTWWETPAKDAAIFDACAAAGGEYVYIGDLFKSRENTDLLETVDANNDVNRHPHDWGMARIAERVRRALR